MKMGLFTVLFNDKPLHTTADVTPLPRPAEGRVGLRGVRARRLARLESLRHRPRGRGPEVREGDQDDAGRARHRDLRALEPPLLADGAAVRRLVARRVGGHIGQGGDGQARPRPHHQDGAGRLGARDRHGRRAARRTRRARHARSEPGFPAPVTSCNAVPKRSIHPRAKSRCARSSPTRTPRTARREASSSSTRPRTTRSPRA